MRQLFVIINTADDDPVTDDQGRLFIYTDEAAARRECAEGHEHVEPLDWNDTLTGELTAEEVADEANYQATP